MIEAEKFLTATLRSHPAGQAVTRILAAAIRAVEPSALLQRWVQRDGEYLQVADRIYPLINRRLHLIALGKAGVSMAQALMETLGEGQISGGIVVTKHSGDAAFPASILLLEGAHPVPDERSLQAGHHIAQYLTGLQANDLVFVLISGGASALATLPPVGIALEDIQALTASLLRCGASISEINTLRRHLDRLKGGNLARMASPAQVVALILSDVPGNSLEAIASGPAAPDPTTVQDALTVLDKYHLRKEVSSSIFLALEETPKPGDVLFSQVQNVIIGHNLYAAQAALKQARQEGFHPYLMRVDLSGEASQAAVELCRDLRYARQRGDPVPAPSCIIAGGETTVTLNAHPGRGGRNQELALAAVNEVANLPGIMLVTLATDGEDGPTDAAGAVVTGETYARAYAQGLHPIDFLLRHDSYSFFTGIEDALLIGPTGTNVNDLVLLFTF